jgi:GNAT superfamily N-acetyltransferase
MSTDRATPTWAVRAYQPGDEEGILALARTVFTEQPADRFSTAYWAWEFVDNPDGAARLWLADDGGTIVGHYAIIPRMVRVGDERLRGSIVVDVMSHPDYRKQGMFTSLGSAALADAGQVGIDFSYGFPIRHEVMPGHLKIGWHHLFDIPVLVRPLRFGPLTRRYVDLPIVSTVAAGAAWAGYHAGLRPVLRLLHRAPSGGDPVHIREVTRCDERFDALWDASGHQFQVVGERTRHYLNWRYRDHPYHAYQLFAAERGGRLMGYLVGRTGDLLGLRCGIVVDVLAHPDCRPCVDALIEHALGVFAARDDLQVVGTMLARSSPYFNAFQRHGFVPTPHVFWFILRANRAGLPAVLLSPRARWHLTWGDTDVI